MVEKEESQSEKVDRIREMAEGHEPVTEVSGGKLIGKVNNATKKRRKVQVDVVGRRLDQ